MQASERNAYLFDYVSKNPDVQALFFTTEGVLINTTTQQPYHEFAQTMQDLALDILAAHQDGNYIIVQCVIPLSAQQLKTKNSQIVDVKSFLPQTDPITQSTILKAYQWLNWHQQAKFCGRCGHPLKNELPKIEKACEICKVVYFPKLSPAVMVLIHRTGELLLARSPHFKPGVYSAIAGFIELGETAEMAAHREVKEELGIAVTDLKYFGTQTWPFPESFMVAFTAEYLSGELQIDKTELEDARWFKMDSLPKLPSGISISKRLIDSMLKGD